MLGDPAILLFDEPVNGLDLDGVSWIRALLRRLADDGRTVFVSSHLMSELQLIALGSLGGQRVRVRTTAPDELVSALTGCNVLAARTKAEEVEIEGLSAAEISTLAHNLGIPVRDLAEVEQSLEHAYRRLTENSVEYRGESSNPALDARDGADR